MADVLTDAEIDIFVSALWALELELGTTVGRSQEGGVPVDLEAPIGRLSRMDAIQQQQMSKAVEHRSQLSLQQVKAALWRVDEGVYGDCLSCDEPIGSGRLRAQPEAPFCVACQSARERRG